MNEKYNFNYDWSEIDEDIFKSIQNGNDNIYSVHVGDVCIELRLDEDCCLVVDYYVLGEVANGIPYAIKYDGTPDGTPYDLIDGFAIDNIVLQCFNYEMFKECVQSYFEDTCRKFKSYDLVGHAQKELKIW